MKTTELALGLDCARFEIRQNAEGWTSCREGLVATSEFSGPRTARTIRIETSRSLLMTGYRLIYLLRFPGGDPLRVHHHALPRLHREMTLPATKQLGESSLPRTEFSSPGNYDLPAGHQDMALHNAFVVFQPGGAAVLLGPLSEKRAKAGFRWRLIDESSLEVTMEFVCTGTEGWSLKEGSCFDGEMVYEEALNGCVEFGPRLFDGYHEALRTSQFLGRVQCGPTSRHELTWGSWNEGIYRNIDEELILAEAAWIAQNLPNVRWIQIDDGFEKDADKNPLAAASLGAHWREETSWCRRRFPRGMRALADDIRSLGLRPMIWFSPSCTIHSDLFHSHPDYFIPHSNLHFEQNLVFADFSLAEVRDLVRGALDRLLIEWRFEGVKLDFWTYGFEQHRMKVRGADRTSLEWLRWLEEEIRVRLPEDGLMLSCLEPANGNPFRSHVWDHHRVGPDITGGLSISTFEEIAIAVATLTGLKQTQRSFWQPNVDGLSLFRYGGSADDSKWRLITAFMVGSGAVTELAGRLSQQEADSRMRAFRKVVASIRHGQDVICPGYDWVNNNGRAPFVWARRDQTGGGVLSVTNWSNQAGEWTVTPRELGIPDGMRLVSVFSGEQTPLPVTRVLPGGDGELWQIIAPTE